MSEDFATVLTEFKRNESPENIIPLTTDQELCNALVAWKSVTVRFKKMEDCSFESEVERWNWMWTRIEYDLQEFGVVAGVRPQDVSRIFDRLKGLRLIYPDGTISASARQYLNSMIMQKLTGKKVGRPSKAESK